MFLTLEELEKLPTPRLLALYKKWRAGAYRAWAFWGNKTIPPHTYENRVVEYVLLIKSILDTREHIEK